MAEFNLPFRADMKAAVLAGKKTCTSRMKKYCDPGDTFRLDGRVFKVWLVEATTLGGVREVHFKAEGCESPADFERVWCEIHPRKGFYEHQRVYVHHFEEVVVP